MKHPSRLPYGTGQMALSSKRTVDINRDQRLVKSNRKEMYEPPRPASSWRNRTRFAVVMGGSAFIGSSMAMGLLGPASGLLIGLGISSALVLSSLTRQNQLGQNVMGGIVSENLDRALAAGEQALEEAPQGAMQTLAAANLASVLMQQDRIDDGSRVLDLYPPRWPHIPVATILWKNNRAFACLVDGKHLEKADALLSDAEIRLEKAGVEGSGGTGNYRKIASALNGTRAMQLIQANRAKEALLALDRSEQLDDDTGSTFRRAERELCRTEALRRTNRQDEAILVATALASQKLTPRQHEIHRTLLEKLGLEGTTPSPMDDSLERDV